MNTRHVAFWRWLKTSIASAKGHGSRRVRRPTNGWSKVAAQVEQLESRQLLAVTFHGGALLTKVEAQAVYLGSDWQNNASLHSQAAQLDQFVATIVQSAYMDALNSAGYGVGRGTASTGVVVNVGINKLFYLTDSQIQADLQSLVAHNQVQAPDANRLYIVYVEPGVAISADGGTSISNFLGYHSTFVGRTASGQSTNIRYAVMPYPGSPNPSSGSDGFSSNFAQLTAVTSHELSEAVTDPDAFTRMSGGQYIGGWWDDAYLRANQGPEIGDITEQYRTTFDGYTVQEMSDKNDRPIDPNNYGGGGQGQLVAPTLSGYATSATTAILNWNAVSGAQGYRIYWWNGSQPVLLATLAASTASVQITGLNAGTTSYFRVEAFNSTQVADSAWVGITTASTQKLTAPQVGVTSVSPNSVVLSWNYQPAALGYRIYWWNGRQAVLLGTVGGSTNSVQITGLSPGTTNYFLVEAFNNSQVADSQWIGVVTPWARAAAGKVADSSRPPAESVALSHGALVPSWLDGSEPERLWFRTTGAGESIHRTADSR
jgi:hypothetical protein